MSVTSPQCLQCLDLIPSSFEVAGLSTVYSSENSCSPASNVYVMVAYSEAQYSSVSFNLWYIVYSFPFSKPLSSLLSCQFSPSRLYS